MFLCAMVCGYEGFRAFSIYGEEKIIFLKAIYPFEKGIPSHDTFARIFTLLCPKKFSLLLTHWTENLKDNLPGLKHIAFDGKTLRGSRKPNNKHSATHVVSAFASQSRLTLTQCKAPHKGYGENEAMLEILDYLRVSGAIITADAASCRKPIAQAITDKKADYVLALKGNQRGSECVLQSMNLGCWSIFTHFDASALIHTQDRKQAVAAHLSVLCNKKTLPVRGLIYNI